MGLCETDGQVSPITAQLYAAASPWANRNGQEEANGNEANLQLAYQERGMADSNSFGGKCTLLAVYEEFYYVYNRLIDSEMKPTACDSASDGKSASVQSFGYVQILQFSERTFRTI